MQKQICWFFSLLNSCGPFFFPPVIFVLYSFHVDTKLNELGHISKMFHILKLCAGVIYKCRNDENIILYAIDKE